MRHRKVIGGTVQVNLSLSRRLMACLEGREVNRSAVAEAALWRAVNGQSTESQLECLRLENAQLRNHLNQVAEIAALAVKAANGGS